MADVNSVNDIVEQIHQLGDDRGHRQFKKELSHRCSGKLIGDICLILSDHNLSFVLQVLLFVFEKVLLWISIAVERAKVKKLHKIRYFIPVVCLVY